MESCIYRETENITRDGKDIVRYMCILNCALTTGESRVCSYPNDSEKSCFFARSVTIQLNALSKSGKK